MLSCSSSIVVADGGGADFVVADEDEVPLSWRVWIVWSEDVLESYPVIPRGRGPAQDQVRELGRDIAAAGPSGRGAGVPHGPAHGRCDRATSRPSTAREAQAARAHLRHGARPHRSLAQLLPTGP